MEYAIDAPDFAERRVTVRTAGPFSAPKVLVDGTIAEKNGDAWLVPGAEGASIPVTLMGRGLDPLPAVQVAGKTLSLAPPLRWFEYLWAALPLALVALGGALGGVFAVLAAYINLYLLRARHGSAARYGLTGAVTVGAICLYYLLGIALVLMLGLVPKGEPH